MPASQHTSQVMRARLLIDEERELPLSSQLARWRDRHAAAKDWELVCRTEVNVLQEAYNREVERERAALRLEVDGIVEAATPPAA